MAKKVEGKPGSGENVPATTGDDSQLPVAMPKTINELFTSDYVKKAIQNAAPKHLDAARFLRIANTALTKVPKLAQCTLPSFWNCLIELSSLGLEPNGRDAHLIPYGKECTLIVDYKGIVECVRRSGEVSDIYADVVCDNDEFVFDRGQVTAHKIDFKAPRGEMYAAYSYVKFKDGTESYQVMSKEEVESIRGRSKMGDGGPWKNDYNEMAKKTVFRRHSKWLPFSAEIKNVIEADDRHLFPDIGKTSVSENDVRKMPNGSRTSLRNKMQDQAVDTTTESSGELSPGEMLTILLTLSEDDMIAAREACGIEMGVDFSEDPDMVKLVYAAMKELKGGAK